VVFSQKVFRLQLFASIAQTTAPISQAHWKTDRVHNFASRCCTTKLLKKQGEKQMNVNAIKVEIRLFTKIGSPVRAYADVSLEVSEGVIVMIGFAIIEKNGKSPFVGFPSKAGTIRGKFFPVIDLQGDIRDLICKAILDAYGKHGTN